MEEELSGDWEVMHVMVDNLFLWCVQEVAGLKEEDLPSDPSTAAGSSSTLSESQYTHVHKL